MMTAAQCLEKADEMDVRAHASSDEWTRNSYIETAKQWRQVSSMARQQDTWAETYDS
jgi:hypothetical protein